LWRLTTVFKGKAKAAVNTVVRHCEGTLNCIRSSTRSQCKLTSEMEDEQCRSVQSSLKPVHEVRWNANQRAVPVVQTRQERPSAYGMWPSVPINGSDVAGGGQRSSSTSFAEHASAWKGSCRYRYRGDGRFVL